MKKLTFLIIFYFNCSSLYYHPTDKVFITPDKMGFLYQDLWIDTPDGERLHLWRIYTKNTESSPKAILLQFHGNGENMSSHFLSLAWLVNSGYELITYDYRGYGNSTGTPDPYDIIGDSKLVLDVVAERANSSQIPLVVYGQSLGGAVAMRSIAEWDKKDKVNLLVIDGSFASYRKVAKQTINGVLFRPLGYIFSMFFHDGTSPKELIPNLSPVPILVIHGSNDEVVPYDNGVDIFSLAKDPKTFWEIRGGGHVDWMVLGRSEFAKDFLKLLNRHLLKRNRDF